MVWIYMGNVVVTVVKYSALCVYSMSIQPINKLYLFSLTRSSIKLKPQKHHLHIDQYSGRYPQVFKVTFWNCVLTNAALHCFCKREMHLIVLKLFFSLMFSFTVTHVVSQTFRFPVPLNSVNCSLSLWWLSIDKLFLPIQLCIFISFSMNLRFVKRNVL